MPLAASCEKICARLANDWGGMEAIMDFMGSGIMAAMEAIELSEGICGQRAPSGPTAGGCMYIAGNCGMPAAGMNEAAGIKHCTLGCMAALGNCCAAAAAAAAAAAGEMPIFAIPITMPAAMVGEEVGGGCCNPALLAGNAMHREENIEPSLRNNLDKYGCRFFTDTISMYAPSPRLKHA